VWGDDPNDVKKGLRVLEKSVPDRDEDTATIAVEAARSALRRSGLDGADIGAWGWSLLITLNMVWR